VSVISTDEPLDLEEIVIDGQVWLVCPYGGPSCGRVLADSGQMGMDCMSWHLRYAHWDKRLVAKPLFAAPNHRRTVGYSPLVEFGG
jgi:hypothetical protein